MEPVEGGTGSPNVEEKPRFAAQDADQGWKYLESHDQASQPEYMDMKALRRRIDWHIVPIMFACYTMQFLDKVLINYAAVMGLNQDLKLKGNNFTNAATAFFIAYLIAEIPNVYFLQKVPAAKWLGANVVLWGLMTAFTGAVKDYGGLLAVRILLGVFEATIGPSLMLISSQWYTKSEQAPRFSCWYLGLGLGQISGGILSFGFQHVENASIEGWRVMFIVLGIVTVIIGICTFLLLPDTPMQARWLSEEQKVSLLRHVSVNQVGIINRRFRMGQVVEALLDPQVYLLTLCVILQSVSSGVVTTYSATLIRSLGFSPKNAALLNMPSGIVSITFVLLVGFGIRHASNRWAWIAFCSIPGMIGGGLMSFLPHTNTAGLLMGIYLVNAITAPLPIIYQWTAANCAGHTKRAFASAAVAGSFSVGNIIGPQTFQARDAPDYHPAKVAVLATQAGAAVVAVILFLYYYWANKKRGAETGLGPNQAEEVNAQHSSSETEAWGGLTDKENRNFRYVY
ncbi:MAG: hypothetical protein M1833_005252 [Piccolia ochrophora]|nr:MAG: hypothetical protein M1833_005252 [Piccolia ochrophora]